MGSCTKQDARHKSSIRQANKIICSTYLTGKFTTVGFFSTKNMFFVNLCITNKGIKLLQTNKDTGIHSENELASPPRDGTSQAR